MPLLNYTTQISADKTVTEIQWLLAKAGANRIVNDYDGNGFIVAMAFSLDINGQTIGFRLPTDWRPVQAVLSEQRVSKSLQTQEQALRVSWRIVKDWIEAQLAIIESQMVTMDQVFLPYAMTKLGNTLYDEMKQSGHLLLSGGNQ
jgi:hypothetical protein